METRPPVVNRPSLSGISAARGTQGPVPGRALRIAGVLTALDGLAVGAYGIWILIALLTRPRGTSTGVATFLGVLLLCFGGGILLAGRNLWRGNRRGRAPALVTHAVLLFLVPGQLAGGSLWLGVPLAVVSTTALVCLFVPSSVRYLARAPLPGAAGPGAAGPGGVSPRAPRGGSARRR